MPIRIGPLTNCVRRGLRHTALVAILLVGATAAKTFAQVVGRTDTTMTSAGAAAGSRGSIFDDLLSRQMIRLDFEHVLTLSKWGAGVFLHPAALNNFLQQPAYIANFTALSRYREEDQNLTTEATGLITGLFAPSPSEKWLLFATMFGTSYISNTPIGIVPSPISITRATDGYGIAGIQVLIPGTDDTLSFGGGIARQSQPNASGYGTIVRGDVRAPSESIADASTIDWNLAIDERFFNQRDQRYTNDRLRLHTTTLFGEGASTPLHSLEPARIAQK